MALTSQHLQTSLQTCDQAAVQNPFSLTFRLSPVQCSSESTLPLRSAGWKAPTAARSPCARSVMRARLLHARSSDRGLRGTALAPPVGHAQLPARRPRPPGSWEWLWRRGSSQHCGHAPGPPARGGTGPPSGPRNSHAAPASPPGPPRAARAQRFSQRCGPSSIAWSATSSTARRTRR